MKTNVWSRLTFAGQVERDARAAAGLRVPSSGARLDSEPISSEFSVL
jgi:hypothetical protein